MIEHFSASLPARRLLPGRAVSVVPLGGGAASGVWLVSLADGRRVVLKATEGLPSHAYAAEAEGLWVLRVDGGLRTPAVLGLGSGGLVIEAFAAAPAEDAVFWERAGQAVAGLHQTSGERFGWHTDGWLGRLPQRNTWTTDGHAFFAEHRLLRYLEEPLVHKVLDAAQRADLESIARRLPQLVPAAQPVLTHGDLWRGNVVMSGDGDPVFIDPAVCWMWAAADLSMMFCTGMAPRRFFDAYQERLPLADGWRSWMELLHLREMLSCAAHFGDRYRDVARLREVIRKFR